MRETLLTLLIGAIAGSIDVLPMIKMKLDKYSASSALIPVYRADLVCIIGVRQSLTKKTIQQNVQNYGGNRMRPKFMRWLIGSFAVMLLLP